MWLLIDDQRNLNTDAIARTAEAGKKLLALGGWEWLCLDHDLGKGETGYDVLTWAIEHNYVPPNVQLVSSNPVGCKNMRAALEHHGYITTNGINFSLRNENGSE